MKKDFSLLLFLFISFVSFGQNQQYNDLIKKAEAFYDTKNYKNSGLTYTEAFKANDGKGLSNDRYNAACSWALANYPDSAFYHLYKIANSSNLTNYNHLSTDSDLKSLHNDKRWNSLLEIVKKNKDKAEANLNKPLVMQLDSIYNEDQKYRRQQMRLKKEFGQDSKEMQAHWKIIHEKDSINLLKVKAILDKHGWLGADVIGSQGNSTLFLVIQHADLTTQKKYLPMMREAVKNGKASGSSLALLEDRVALGQGKKQIYGSQIGRNAETNLLYILPLEDPDNVDKRRANVGLQPLAEYVKRWEIKWDIDQYKKELAEKEAKKK